MLSPEIQYQGRINSEFLQGHFYLEPPLNISKFLEDKKLRQAALNLHSTTGQQEQLEEQLLKEHKVTRQQAQEMRSFVARNNFAGIEALKQKAADIENKTQSTDDYTTRTNNPNFKKPNKKRVRARRAFQNSAQLAYIKKHYAERSPVKKSEAIKINWEIAQQLITAEDSQNMEEIQIELAKKYNQRLTTLRVRYSQSLKAIIELLDEFNQQNHTTPEVKASPSYSEEDPSPADQSSPQHAEP